MISEYLPYGEQDALDSILKYHDIDDPVLTKQLAQLMNWVRETEEDKSRLSRRFQAPMLIVLLGQMGILTPKKKEPVDG
jgi:hypothetical protein